MAIIIGIIVCAIDVVNVDRPSQKYQISVIVDDSNSARWDSFQTGLRQAARENGIRLNYVTTDFEGDSEKEKSLIEQEIENGADAVIVQLCSGSGASEILSDISTDIYIELIDNNVSREEIGSSKVSFTGADSTEVGSELAKRIEEEFTDLKDVRIGILAGNLKLVSVQERIDSFKEVSQVAGAQIVFSVEATQLSEREIGELVKSNKADILVALDNDVTQTAANYIKMVDNYNSYPSNDLKDIKLYGIGCSPDNLNDLDQGIIRGMVVINEYEMGYMAIKNLVDVLKDNQRGISDYTVGYAYVTGETMYDEGNQQILFPIGE